MENNEQTVQITKEHKKHTLHHTLAKSYMVYFIVLIFVVALDIFFPSKFLEGEVFSYIGFVFLIIA
jgi:glycopeptide antibiotics resistance protein